MGFKLPPKPAVKPKLAPPRPAMKEVAAPPPRPAKKAPQTWGTTPAADTAEVVLYEPQTPGRSALEVACAAHGLTWGIIRMRVSGNVGQATHSALVLIGKPYEVESETDVDDALLSLAAAIEEEHGGG